MNMNDTGDHNKDYKDQCKQLGNPLQKCEHCYCESLFINSQKHIVCCMCGHRRLLNPITC